MNANEVIDLVIGVGVAGGALGFLYFILDQIDPNATQAFLKPIADNWAKIVIVVIFGSVLGFIVPVLRSLRKAAPGT